MSAPELVGPAHKARPRTPGPQAPSPHAPRHLRIVGDHELATIRRRRRLRVGSVVLAGFVIALLFAAVGMHVMLAQNQFRLNQLANQAAAQQAKYQQLRLQVDQLSSPQAIIGAAEARLGMVPAGNVTFLNPSSAIPGRPDAVAQSGPAPATAPSGWSTVKPQLAANP